MSRRVMDSNVISCSTSRRRPAQRRSARRAASVSAAIRCLRVGTAAGDPGAGALPAGGAGAPDTGPGCGGVGRDSIGTPARCAHPAATEQASSPATSVVAPGRDPPPPTRRGPREPGTARYRRFCPASQFTTTVIGVLRWPAVSRNRKRCPSGATS